MLPQYHREVFFFVACMMLLQFAPKINTIRIVCSPIGPFLNRTLVVARVAIASALWSVSWLITGCVNTEKHMELRQFYAVFVCVCQTLVVGIYDLIYEICIRDIFGYRY